ncbi:hypothetical protein HDV00_000724 [Rhizophlyctis rosea]|nr:hypothetical protein HDV00_000724 [Rhizophlyctis rosea]
MSNERTASSQQPASPLAHQITEPTDASDSTTTTRPGSPDQSYTPMSPPPNAKRQRTKVFDPSDLSSVARKLSYNDVQDVIDSDQRDIIHPHPIASTPYGTSYHGMSSMSGTTESMMGHRASHHDLGGLVGMPAQRGSSRDLGRVVRGGMPSTQAKTQHQQQQQQQGAPPHDTSATGTLLQQQQQQQQPNGAGISASQPSIIEEENPFYTDPHKQHKLIINDIITHYANWKAQKALRKARKAQALAAFVLAAQSAKSKGKTAPMDIDTLPADESKSSLSNRADSVSGNKNFDAMDVDEDQMASMLESDAHRGGTYAVPQAGNVLLELRSGSEGLGLNLMSGDEKKEGEEREVGASLGASGEASGLYRSLDVKNVPEMTFVAPLQVNYAAPTGEEQKICASGLGMHVGTTKDDAYGTAREFTPAGAKGSAGLEDPVVPIVPREFVRKIEVVHGKTTGNAPLPEIVSRNHEYRTGEEEEEKKGQGEGDGGGVVTRRRRRLHPCESVCAIL